MRFRVLTVVTAFSVWLELPDWVVASTTSWGCSSWPRPKPEIA